MGTNKMKPNILIQHHQNTICLQYKLTADTPEILACFMMFLTLSFEAVICSDIW